MEDLFSEDSILFPDASVVSSSTEALEYFQLLEGFYDTPLYDKVSREFLFVSGESSLALSGRNPSLVVFGQDTNVQANIMGGSHVFIANGDIGSVEITGGSVQFFISDLPEQDTTFSVSGGLLELNLLPPDLSEFPVVEILDGRLFVGGEPSNILLSGGDYSEPEGIIKITSLNKVHQLVIPPKIAEDIFDGQDGDQFLLDDGADFYISDSDLEALLLESQSAVSIFGDGTIVTADDLDAAINASIEGVNVSADDLYVAMHDSILVSSEIDPTRILDSHQIYEDETIYQVAACLDIYAIGIEEAVDLVVL